MRLYWTTCCGLFIIDARGEDASYHNLRKYLQRSCVMVISDKGVRFLKGKRRDTDRQIAHVEFPSATCPTIGGVHYIRYAGSFLRYNLCSTFPQGTREVYLTLANHQGLHARAVEEGFEVVHKFINESTGNTVQVYRKTIRKRG